MKRTLTRVLTLACLTLLSQSIFAQNSLGLVPQSSQANALREAQPPQLMAASSRAWCYNGGGPFQLNSQFLANTTVTPIGSPATYGFPGGATWVTSVNQMYVVDQVSPFGMYTVDTTTGATTFIANCTGITLSNLTGIAWDPTTGTLFGMQSSISQSQLLTINLTTGVCTPIGPVSTVSPGAISLSCTSNGTLFSIDIVTDQLHRWNRNTGVATVVGPLGFDANYGQDTQFDQTDDVLYGAVFNNSTFAPELRVIDTLTGTATFIGTYANTIQVQTIAIRPACAATTFSQTLSGCAPFSVTVGSSTYTTTGTYTDVLVNAQGCDSTVTTNLTVHALPTVGASSSASAICAGDSVTVMGSGATSYAWTAGVNDNVPFAPAATDTYTVTGTDGNGCSNTATVTVTVNALPSVGASSTASAICAGDSVTAMGSGAGMYVWTGGISDNVAFAPAVTDTYTVTGTDANGCSDTASVMITVNALPVVTVSLTMDTACSGFGNMITLDGESPIGGTWSGNNVSGNMLDVDSASLGSNMIMYTYTDTNGCTAMAMDSIYVDLCLAVNENAAGHVSVYPNPTSGEFTVQLNGSTTATVEIMNELGQVVNAFTMTSSVRTVDMNNFESGVYFIRVIEGDATTTHRLIKH